MSITHIAPIKQLQKRWHERESIEGFDDVMEKLHGSYVCKLKGEGKYYTLLEISWGSIAHDQDDYTILWLY